MEERKKKRELKRKKIVKDEVKIKIIWLKVNKVKNEMVEIKINKINIILFKRKTKKKQKKEDIFKNHLIFKNHIIIY